MTVVSLMSRLYCFCNKHEYILYIKWEQKSKFKILQIYLWNICVVFVLYSLMKFVICPFSVVTLPVKKATTRLLNTHTGRSPENYYLLTIHGEFVYNNIDIWLKNSVYSRSCQKSFPLFPPFYSIFYLCTIFIKPYVKNFSYTIYVICHTLCIVVYLYNTGTRLSWKNIYVTLNAWTETLENPVITYLIDCICERIKVCFKCELRIRM